jgi:MFS family permease
MPKERAGYGTTIVAGVGILGAVVAALVGDASTWRTAYFVGGGLGLALLLLRVGVYESGMFQRDEGRGRAHGELPRALLAAHRLRRYARHHPRRRADLVRRGHPRHVLAGDREGAWASRRRPKPSTAVMLMYIGLASATSRERLR